MNKPFFSILIPSKDRADLINDLICDVESKEWFQEFNIENVETKDDVNKRNFFLRDTAFKANIFYYAKTRQVAQYFLKIYRIFKYKNFGIIYIDVKDFL